MSKLNLAVAVAASKIGSTADSLSINAIMDNPKTQRYTAEFNYTEGGVTKTAVLCNDSGKVKVFADVDTILKTLAKAAPQLETIVASSAVGAFSPDRLVYDVAAQDARDLVTYTAKLAAQTSMVTAITAKLAAVASWETGNALQMAAWNKLSAELATAAGLKTFYQDKVTSLS